MGVQGEVWAEDIYLGVIHVSTHIRPRVNTDIRGKKSRTESCENEEELLKKAEKKRQ